MKLATMNHVKIIALFASVAPVAAAIITLSILASRPAPAFNTDAGAYDPADFHVRSIKLSPAQHAAADFCTLAINTPQDGSPFLYSEAPALPIDMDGIPGIDTQHDPNMPDLLLTGIISSAGMQRAVINGHLASVGDEPSPGWRVLTIDADTRAVTLTNAEEGRTVTIEIQAAFQRPRPPRMP